MADDIADEITGGSEADSQNAWDSADGPLDDPEERRVLFAAIDSF